MAGLEGGDFAARPREPLWWDGRIDSACSHLDTVAVTGG